MVGSTADPDVPPSQACAGAAAEVRSATSTLHARIATVCRILWQFRECKKQSGRRLEHLVATVPMFPAPVDRMPHQACRWCNRFDRGLLLSLRS